MSQRAGGVLPGLRFVMLVASTSTGRNTVIQELIKSPEYHFVISDTTRPPQKRDGQMEQNGVHYFFRSEEEILSDLKAGEFLEAAIIHEQQVSGISIRELEKAKTLNKIAITDMETVGADNVMHAKPDAKAIFLLPPNFDEWQRRILSRGYMSPQEIRNRLTSAHKEFQTALSSRYYQFVIANNVKQAAGIVDSLAHGGSNPHQDTGRSLIHHLDSQLEHKLATMPG